MEGGSSSAAGEKVHERKGLKLGSVLPKIEPFMPRKNFYDPRDLRSWAKKTGFVSTFSGETDRGSVSGRNVENVSEKLDLEKGIEKKESLSPKIEIDPILGRTRNRAVEIEQDLGVGNGRNMNKRDGGIRGENQMNRVGHEPKNEDGRDGLNGAGIGNANGAFAGNRNGAQPAAQVTALKKEGGDGEEEMGILGNPDGEDPSYGAWHQSPKMKCGLRENPGFG